MKKALFVIALAAVLTFAMTTAAFATTGKFFANSTSYYHWTKPAVKAPGTASPNGLSGIGANPANPGAHANYLANTAKCGMCHSVHRAAADAGQVKLLESADASCAGCHTGSTAVTAKIVTWTPYNINWVPETNLPGGVGGTAWMDEFNAGTLSSSGTNPDITNAAAAGGAAAGGGPHNDSALDLVVDGYWDGTGTTPAPSYVAGERYGCFTRRCHATNPHGANSSKYPLFAAKLLFNNTVAEDDEEYLAETGTAKTGTYGGDDAQYDALGAIDASVARFAAANPTAFQANADGSILIKKVAAGETAWRAPDAAETHALVAGMTCGRPSNPGTGEDECHAEAVYAVFDKSVTEFRNAPTEITSGSAYRTDNTGEEALGYGGNDNRVQKTGHVAGTFAAVPGSGSYVAISGCTGCHDQKDGANTVFGNYTFPHGQVATGATNLTFGTSGDTTVSNPYNRARIWMGWSGFAGDTLRAVENSNMKAYDGNCLKCHRDTSNTEGIGLTK